MIKQHFLIDIKAPIYRVRHTMINDQSYRKRTSAFNPGSYFEGDWSLWSQIKFLGPDPQNPEKIWWMLAEIVENKPLEYISIKHIWEIRDWEVRTDAPWTNAFENYSFSEKDGITTVKIDTDMTEEYADYMSEARGKALEILKELCEKPATKLTVSTSIYATLEKVWNAWNTPEDIMSWNHAWDDWHCPASTSDLRVDGIFSATMAAKDGSFSFDFTWKYTAIEPMKYIAYTMWEMKEYFLDAWRKVEVTFEDNACGTIRVTETFDAEEIHNLDMQKAWWQAILDNFKKHVESK